MGALRVSAVLAGLRSLSHMIRLLAANPPSGTTSGASIARGCVDVSHLAACTATARRRVSSLLAITSVRPFRYFGSLRLTCVLCVWLAYADGRCVAIMKQSE